MAVVPRKQRAQGTPGGSAAPTAPRANKKQHMSVVTTGTPKRPGVPCAMVLTVSFVVFPETGLCCLRHRRDAKHLRRLDTSVGVSERYDFAVHLQCVRLAHDKRPPHPAPNVRDDRDTPLMVGTGWAELCW